MDAGDKDLILAWARAGILPTFRSLLETSAWGTTQNPVGFFVGAVWPSFWTGLSPEKHGRYCFSQLRTGTYDHYDVNPRDTRGEPFWDELCAKGCRVAILDVPKTVPSPKVNGIHIVDWGTHDPELDFCTAPESLASEIEARFGLHPLDTCDEFMKRYPTDHASLRDALVTGVRRKADLAAHFFELGGWDLFLTVFAESHCVGHHCWHLHDPKHPRHDANVARVVGDPVRDVYVAIDAALGRLIALRRARDDECSSSRATGWARTTTARSFWGKCSAACSSSRSAPPSKRAVARLLESIWHRLPSSLHSRLRSLRGRTKQALGVAASVSGACGPPLLHDAEQRRLRRHSRQPRGPRTPGPDPSRRGVRRLLRCAPDRPPRLRQPGHGTAVGPARAADSDLYKRRQRPGPAGPARRVGTGRAHLSNPVSQDGLIEEVFPGRRTGDHKPEGLLFARGPGIVPRRLDRPVEITQLAPTIASLLGVQLSKPDAEPVAELITRRGSAAAP